MILSNNKNTYQSIFDPLGQLKLIRDKCNKISSYLYKVKASYLDEIRSFLPQAIKTSLFSLITDKDSNDFGFSTAKSRRIFQFEIDKLVLNNIPLLTIEHLIELAKKIDEDNLRNITNAKNEMAKALRIKNSSEKSSPFEEYYSIHLSSLPPLENLSIIEGWNGELQFPYSIDDQDNYTKRKKDQVESSDNYSHKDDENIMDVEQKMDSFNLKGDEIEILQSIFALTDESDSNDLDLKAEVLHQKSNSFVEDNNRLLPETPLGLYEWMISIDTALVRRLRDLSHAINSELLRSGLVNTLVPLNILDSALAGQLISSKSISNVLTLKLPTSSSLGNGNLDIDCLLITPSDLEFDNPRLRRNRIHIKHYQNLLLGMIKQQRYWQGRSLAEEVGKTWWKDTTKI